MLLNASDEPVDVPRFQRSAQLVEGVLEIIQSVLESVDLQILCADLHIVQVLLLALRNASK